MGYSLDDIVELVHYHVTLGAPTAGSAHVALASLVERVIDVAAVDGDADDLWIICDRCGASVSGELIVGEGAGFTADGGSYCSTCRGR
jgi:hypothetical protein